MPFLAAGQGGPMRKGRGASAAAAPPPAPPGSGAAAASLGAAVSPSLKSSNRRWMDAESPTASLSAEDWLTILGDIARWTREGDGSAEVPDSDSCWKYGEASLARNACDSLGSSGSPSSGSEPTSPDGCWRGDIFQASLGWTLPARDFSEALGDVARASAEGRKPLSDREAEDCSGRSEEAGNSEPVVSGTLSPSKLGSAIKQADEAQVGEASAIFSNAIQPDKQSKWRPGLESITEADVTSGKEAARKRRGGQAKLRLEIARSRRTSLDEEARRSSLDEESRRSSLDFYYRRSFDMDSCRSRDSFSTASPLTPGECY